MPVIQTIAPRGALAVDLLPAIDGVDQAEWQAVLSRGDSNVVFLTREWQQAWWETYGWGQLMVLAARREGHLVALAPLFADDEGMVYFAGSGGCGSDYLDFIGDVSDPEVLDGLLGAARDRVDRFAGFRFYLVPDRSRTSHQLAGAAARLGLELREEDVMPAPILDLTRPGAAAGAIGKQSLVRHQRWFERNGMVRTVVLREANEILPHLEEFFAQHIARWEATPYPSLFLTERHRDFYRRLVCGASSAGWLRFTRIEWQDRAIAMHFGFCHHGTYLWYKPSFDVSLARRSPGEVLIRQLLLSAVAEGAAGFDFGIGDESFKHRFATTVPTVRTWGLYPKRRQG